MQLQKDVAEPEVLGDRVDGSTVVELQSEKVILFKLHELQLSSMMYLAIVVRVYVEIFAKTKFLKVVFNLCSRFRLCWIDMEFQMPGFVCLGRKAIVQIFTQA